MSRFKRHLLTEATSKSKETPEAVKKLADLVAKKIGTKLFPYNKNGLQEFEVDGKTYQCFLYFTKGTAAIRFNTINGDFHSVELWNSYKINIEGNKLPVSDKTISLNGMDVNKVMDSLADLIANPKHGTHSLSLNEEILEESAEPNRESNAHREAMRLNLTYMGYGRYGKQGVVTHKSKNDGHDLVPYQHVENDSRMRQVKDPTEFQALAIKTFGDSKSLHRLSMDDLERISHTHGVRLPGWVRNSAQGKGKNKTYSAVPTGGASHHGSGSDEPKARTGNVQYYAKISPRDSVTNKFLSVKDDPEAQRMTKIMDAALNSPSNEEIEKEMVDPDTIFGKLTDLTDLVVDNVSPSLFVYGGAGTGKTFTIQKSLRDRGLVENKDWYLVKGKITPVALYQMLYIHRKDKTLLVFDDADSAFDSDDAANILKAALDSYSKRTISWSSNRTRNVDKFDDDDRLEYEKMIDDRLTPKKKEKKTGNPDAVFPGSSLDDEEDEKENKTPIKLPSKFDFDGKIIFISNLDKSQVDPAVLNRSYKIDMTLTDAQMFKRMKSKIGEMHTNVDMETKEKVLKVLETLTRIGKLEKPSMRTLDSALKLVASGKPNWTDLLEHT